MRLLRLHEFVLIEDEDDTETVSGVPGNAPGGVSNARAPNGQGPRTLLLGLLPGASERRVNHGRRP